MLEGGCGVQCMTGKGRGQTSLPISDQATHFLIHLKHCISPQPCATSVGLSYSMGKLAEVFLPCPHSSRGVPPAGMLPQCPPRVPFAMGASCQHAPPVPSHNI
eukprot:scaffold113026_cov14-Tisochrysis_lutea.AAC.1